MGTEEFLIEFAGSTPAEAGRLAEDLRTKLISADSTILVERKRSDPSAMDGGGTLAAVWGASATASVAKTLSNWLFQNDRITLSIKVKGKEIHIDNVRRQDAAKLTKSLLKAFGE
jgi:hypothetical protein